MSKKRQHRSMEIDHTSFTLTPTDVLKEFTVTVDELKAAYEEREIRSLERVVKKVVNKKVQLVKELYFQREQVENKWEKAKEKTTSEMIQELVKDKPLNYNGYSTKIEYSKEDKLFHGKIEEIDDLISFEAKTIEEFKESFKKAVDEYKPIEVDG